MSIRLKLAGIVSIACLLLIPTILLYASESVPKRVPSDGQLEEGNQQFQAATIDTIDAVVVRSWSGCTSNSVIWDSLNSNWSSYGSILINVIYNYPGLCEAGATITYDKLVASGADVVIISDPGGGLQQFSAAEISAIQQYAQEGHNLIATFLTFHWGGIDNTDLAPLFGIKDSTTFDFTQGPVVVPTYTILEPGNPLFRNLGPSYVSSGHIQSQVPTAGTWDNSLLEGARIVGINADQQAAIMLYQGPDYHAIYISHMPELGGSSIDEQFFYNAITFEAEIEALVLRSWSNCGSGSVIWDALNKEWASYGLTSINIDYNYSGLCGSGDVITYEKLVASGADVLILSDPAGGGQQYSANEISSIQRYAEEGHNLIGTYLTFNWLTTDNSDLAPLFGFKDTTSFRSDISPGVIPTYSYIEPGHHLFTNISEPYASAGLATSQATSSGIWTDSDLDNGRIVAINSAENAAIIANVEGSYHSVYISTMPEHVGGTVDKQFFYNAITQKFYSVYLPLAGRQLCGNFPGPHEAEPNDSVGQANGPLCFSINYTGSPDDKAPAAEFDWFKFSWDGNGTVTVDVTNFLTDAQVLLYHESDTGNFLDQGFGGNYHLTHDGSAGPGVYYILVFSPENHPTGNGDYNLTVTIN